MDYAGVASWKDSYLHRHVVSQSAAGTEGNSNHNKKRITGQLLHLSTHYYQIVMEILHLHSNAQVMSDDRKRTRTTRDACLQGLGTIIVSANHGRR